MTYTQINGPDGEVNPNVIQRDSDGAYIPNDMENVDWIEYVKWCNMGGEPNPPLANLVPPIQEPSDRDIATEILTDHEQRLYNLEHPEQPAPHGET